MTVHRQTWSGKKQITPQQSQLCCYASTVRPPLICLSRLQEDRKNTSREGWKAIIDDLYLSQPHICVQVRFGMVGQSRRLTTLTCVCCVHVWPRHNLRLWLKGGRWFYAHWPRGRNIVRCACGTSEMSVTTKQDKNHRAHQHKQNLKTACSVPSITAHMTEKIKLPENQRKKA